MTSGQVKKWLYGGATLVGFGVVATAALRASDRSKMSNGSTTFAKAFGDEVKAVFKTKAV